MRIPHRRKVLFGFALLWPMAAMPNVFPCANAGVLIGLKFINKPLPPYFPCRPKSTALCFLRNNNRVFPQPFSVLFKEYQRHLPTLPSTCILLLLISIVNLS